MKRLLAIILLFLVSGQIIAQEGLLNKLLAPGPLIEGHKDLEHKDCLECHTAASGVPNDKCLACHKEIKKSVDSGSGFHALHNKDCFKCHADHKGRTFDSTKVDEKTFAHKDTGYELVGKHVEIKCSKCHIGTRSKKPINKTGIRWFGLKQGCLDCHKKDDVHFYKGEFADRDCGKCHGEVSWKQSVKFDHLKDGDYALVGNHAKLKCEKCHVPKGRASAKYEWAGIKEKKCLSCHKDIHGNNLSQKYQNGDCAKCHSQERWKINDFQHSITGFALKGKHAKNECIDCHKQKTVGLKLEKFKWQGLEPECIKCHADYHAFDKLQSKRFGPLVACDHCHKFEGFKIDIDFDHNNDTQFDLTGKHLKNKCFACHKPTPGQPKVKPKSRVYTWPLLESKTCENCHKSPHTNTFPPKLLAKKCTDCHVTDGWDVIRKGLNSGFDHNASRFPLTGRHIKVKCDTCHLKDGKEIYKFPGADQKFCVNCHQSVHLKQFDKNFAMKSCVECHTTSGFKRLKAFNHNKTRFKLTGKHETIRNRCSKCHVPTKQLLAVKPPRAAGRFLFGENTEEFCVECHTEVHERQFDEKFSKTPCKVCHTTETFKKLLKFDHDTTSFPLKDRHLKVKCEECHVPTKNLLIETPPKKAGKYLFPEIPAKNCNTCHTDPHRGNFGRKCDTCHSQKGWQNTRDFHRNFTLNGVHFTLECEACHIDNRRLGGLSEQCLLCHQKDDIHGGTLPNCNECHRQTFWESPFFNHSSTGFPLRGAHRVQECAKCHGNGRYTGRPSDCVDCHATDRASVKTRDHTPPAFESCGNCHNQFSFEGAL
jgi:hypothetical protein